MIRMQCTCHVRLALKEEWTGEATWTYLKERYARTGWAAKWSALNRFEKLKLSDCDTFSEFAARVMDAIAEMEQFEYTEDERLICKLLNDLGPAFDTYVAVLYQYARINE